MPYQIRGSHPRRRRICAVTLAAACALLVGACSSSGSQSASGQGTSSGTLAIAFGNDTPFVDDFNPFSPTTQLPATGLIYEPLWFFDMADSSQNHPWLATSYAWSNGGKTVTFNLRKNVNWTDGTPFTSADVAYTFNLIKKQPRSSTSSALPITSAVAEGLYKVAMNFSSALLHRHQLHRRSDPVHRPRSTSGSRDRQIRRPTPTPTRSAPGPYLQMSLRASGTAMVLTANPHYYLAGPAQDQDAPVPLLQRQYCAST